ncbi:MAG: C4-dicarboxylate ABC transporter substrate-binding protein, partial [Planctomycetes bacterium]|nr:C4-dicarboxylate ABC transporter substrate-binding protein [Planctomycetota bacterium]
MKKWILLAALVVLASSPARALDLRLAHVYETSHPWHIGAAEAADKIRELTEGRVNIIVYP